MSNIHIHIHQGSKTNDAFAPPPSDSDYSAAVSSINRLIDQVSSRIDKETNPEKKRIYQNSLRDYNRLATALRAHNLREAAYSLDIMESPAYNEVYSKLPTGLRKVLHG